MNSIADGMTVIQERDGNSWPQVSYTRGTDLSGSFEPAESRLARSRGVKESSRAQVFAGGGPVAPCCNNQRLNMKTTQTTWLKLLLLWAALAGVFPAHGYYDPGVQRWLNRDPIRELGFEALRAHYTRKGKPTRGDGDNLYKFVGNSPVLNWDYLGLDSPGCDFPATSLPCILPGAADCYLRCCAQHDTCFYDNGCKAATSWAQILCPTKCGNCARQALGCFANCFFGGDGPGNPPYYCAANDRYYYNWDDIPPECWESGTKPPKPDCYP